MVNKYAKALLLTLVLFVLGLGIMSYFDNARVSGISNSIEVASLNTESTYQLLLYTQIFGDDPAICPVLSKNIDSQVEKLGGLLSELGQAKSQGFFADIGLAKRKYLVQNGLLYLLVEKSRKDCGNKGIVPVLYFYPEKYYCAECAAQAAVLNSVVAKCRNVRVFALPYDYGLPLVDLLLEKHGITSFPAVIIGGHEPVAISNGSVIPRTDIMQKIQCQQ